ncbi:hypothetical protein K3G63_01920 [Hymenobacter sp. HSC-4F20]|uniref:hypothetical protein n=1 Tax=Hymenobacter sp. HSC-4F20 TaxID=2864135 RepID=UPI001C7395DF|nr:hypothetical protein [Hymenobacter sp. HSC-4F20]MBX0289174.1 hypothetical protein [Hymenobacter sp. HSC-4F20]
MRNSLHFLRFILVWLLLLGGSNLTYATTWNEPWHDRVVKEADYFVLATVAAAAENSATLTVLATLGAVGSPLTGTVKLTNFYSLDLCSTSGGHGPEFHLSPRDTAYFFLKKNQADTYSLATPTTGFALVKGQRVSATYRHSYHQALLERPAYELTMTAIFQHYHQQPYAAEAVRTFIGQQLAQKPAALNEEELPIFFRQHAALETIYHLGLTEFYAATLPFLRDNRNFHSQISAARALTAVNTPEANQQLLALLADAKTPDFPKIVAIWTLGAHQPKALKANLQRLTSKVSEDRAGFGGNLMDPRICTHLPTVKAALTDLIASL